MLEDNYLADSHSIDGYLTQAKQAWEAGKYYEAGNLVGLVNTYIWKKQQTIM